MRLGLGNIPDSSKTVVDQLYIKTIRRILNRDLTEEEMESVRFGEPVFTQSPSGTWYSFRVPLYKLPDNLMSSAVDIAQIQSTEKKTSFFYLAFGESEEGEVSDNE